VKVTHSPGSSAFFLHTQSKAPKSIGGKWLPSAKVWRLPAVASAVRDTRRLFPHAQLPQTLERVLAEGFELQEESELLSGRSEGLRSMYERLYPFQRYGVRYLVSSPHKASMLVFEQGLGKTPTSLVAASMLYPKHVLVVCQKSLMLNWANEIERWCPEASWSITHGRAPSSVATFNVVNFETVVNRLESYMLVPWNLLIVDESVLVKNRKTQRFKAVNQLRKRATWTWLLSGSPQARYADDLYAQLHICKPDTFSNYWRFAEKYCIVETDVWGPRVVADNPERNAATDNPDFMLVRAQKEVLPELPDLIFQTIPVELRAKQRKVYDSLACQFSVELESAGVIEVPNVMAKLTRLQQVTSALANLEPGSLVSAKVDALVELVEAGLPRPLVVWVHWKETALLVANCLQNEGLTVAVATGDTDASTEIEQFKRGDVEALVLSLGVGRFGHTLTNARSVVYIDKTWHADAYVQSLARVHRIGLKHRPLIVTLKAENTVDEMVEDNLAGKLPGITRINRQDLIAYMKGIGR
jgi:SNF2 family DNA or RNA helicase